MKRVRGEGKKVTRRLRKEEAGINGVPAGYMRAYPGLRNSESPVRESSTSLSMWMHIHPDRPRRPARARMGNAESGEFFVEGRDPVIRCSLINYR